MKKYILFAILLFIPGFVYADSFKNLYNTNWTYDSTALTLQSGFNNVYGTTTRSFKNPKTIRLTTDFAMLDTPQYVVFRTLFRFTEIQDSNLSFANCNEQGYCSTGQITTFLDNSSVVVSMLQDGMQSYCSFLSGSQGASGDFVIQCPVPHKTKHITGLQFELSGGNDNMHYVQVGVGAMIMFHYDSNQEVVDAIKDFEFEYRDGYRATINSLQVINDTLTNFSQLETEAINKSTEAINNSIEQAKKNSENEVNAMNKNTDSINNMNSTISNSNVDVDSSFFSGFDNNTHGLTSIITAPLQLIGSITSSTCSPLGIPMPFGLPSAQLPCMKEIYSQYFGDFFTLYQTLTFGMISYWVCVQTFAIVKGFKDPDSDRIEVLDL